MNIIKKSVTTTQQTYLLYRQQEEVIIYKVRWFLEKKETFKHQSGFQQLHSTHGHLINLEMNMCTHVTHSSANNTRLSYVQTQERPTIRIRETETHETCRNTATKETSSILLLPSYLLEPFQLELIIHPFLHNGLRKRIPITGRYKRRIEHRNNPGQSTIICR